MTSTISKERLRELLLQMKRIQVKGPSNHCYGICANANVYISEIEALVHDWPKYSGDLDFPIESPNPHLSNQEIYRQSSKRETMWSKHSQYGRLRWELLGFMVNKIEAALNE
jgi:hypothetical protein